MSAALHALQPGASVAIKGPFGSFRYQPGKYKAIGERSCYPFHEVIVMQASCSKT